MVFICINELGNASVLFLFDIKKNEPFGGGEPRQDRGRIREDNFTSLVLILNNLIIPQCDKPEEVM
ncbi:hypothetical protein SAMN04488511_105221 [Pedobacter suwonensis]|uniref:Uncharacterized protein n=1 Tax=Pedobacter suwonensis TaxID=332999 RepID=A0A1I0T2M9_9SPHI|nr:hypothetical protein SAMN04488511_105221 [Pedobacter suwonensis]